MARRRHRTRSSDHVLHAFGIPIYVLRSVRKNHLWKLMWRWWHQTLGVWRNACLAFDFALSDLFIAESRWCHRRVSFCFVFCSIPCRDGFRMWSGGVKAPPQFIIGAILYLMDYRVLSSGQMLSPSLKQGFTGKQNGNCSHLLSEK